ncbi:MAG: malate dehydrogenase [Chloroflexi bacterium]|jgi:LDH2 family malate/lactate/ureidoglycolate dehydrogenase|nr:malate dehydrogenase [Chloroflexota bacterium]|tara:strand:- start:150 stop:1226 length:1077 start_codon:yes stop_codon:yes gene_type:complete
MASTDTEVRILIQSDALRRNCEDMLVALGVSAEDATTTVDVFIQAELMGEESHGTRLFLQILGRLKAGGDRAQTKIDVVMDHGAVATWDANRSLGQVVAARAMGRAIEKAKEFGIGFVGVRNSNSYTSAKYYSLLAVQEGLLGITYTNTSRKLMPPEGGHTPILGNNPMSIAAPAGKHPPFVLDMACTKAAMERILQAKERGEDIPADWALDSEGNVTTDPVKAIESGALLPFGGYKAFGLGMAHEVLSSVLFGGLLFCGDTKGFQPYDGAMNTSYSFQAINIELFMPLDEFKDRMDSMIETIKTSKRRPGVDRILVPGERSGGEFPKRLRDGIPLQQRVFGDLARWSEELGVTPLVE